jgi:hypothetical protein
MATTMAHKKKQGYKDGVEVDPARGFQDLPRQILAKAMGVGVLLCAVFRVHSYDEDVSDISWGCVSFGTGCIDMFGLLAQPCIRHG